MRIEFVTDTFPPDINGVAMTLGRLTSMLKKHGHHVHVIHTGQEANEGESLTKSIPFPGYKEVRVGLPSPLKLRKRWRSKRPDAIYVACESPFGVSAMKAAIELKIPVIAGFHTNYQQYFKKYPLIKMLEGLSIGFLRKHHNRCNATMVPSQYMVDMLEKEGFENLFIVGRGVDTDLFNPNQRSDELREHWGASPDDCVIVIVGRVAIEKNLEFSLQTIQELKSEGLKIKTVLVGDGPLRKKLEAKYSGDDFIYAGMQTGDDLAAHYASSDVMLFASETETFGNVITEGMASGLVTASYDYAAANLYVENGVNGFSAELGNEIAMKDTLREAVKHCQNETIKNAALETASTLNWSSVAKKFAHHVEEIISNQPALLRRIKNKTPLKVRSLFLSDIHLGTLDSKAKEVCDVIKHTQCENLYLNGDIIDGWAFRKRNKWKKSHTKVVRTVLKKSEKGKCNVVYTRGNHDDFLTPFLPTVFGDLKVVKEHVHVGVDGKKYLVIHGDGFDSVSTNHRWMAKLGAKGYDFLLGVNRLHNKYRAWRGKAHYSIAKRVKAKVKSALSFIDKYEEQLYDLAKKRGYDGIICGHIHTPADKMIDDVHYLNSGDWVESLTCIVEHYDGTFELLDYKQIVEHFDTSNEEKSPLDHSSEKAETSDTCQTTEHNSPVSSTSAKTQDSEEPKL